MSKTKEVVKCPDCGSTEWTFAGWGTRDHKKEIHRRRCSVEGCRKIFSVPSDSLAAEEDRKLAAKLFGKKKEKLNVRSS